MKKLIYIVLIGLASCVSTKNRYTIPAQLYETVVFKNTEFIKLHFIDANSVKYELVEEKGKIPYKIGNCYKLDPTMAKRIK